VTVRIRFLGSGNAFADGGRSHACIHVSAPGVSLLLDCGASSLPAIRRLADPGLITAVAVTHLHGDHFGGIPFLLDQQKWAFRKGALVVGGPPSLERRLGQLAAAYTMDFATLGFPLTNVVLRPDEQDVAGARIAALPVQHSPGVEPHGLRVRVDGKLIAYSGDARWSDELVAVARGADLFICEASNFSVADEKANPVHLSYETLLRRRAELDCRRIILTHLGTNTLAHLGELQLDHAVDGTELVV
jgi:ribonuclease BN (tRNA processing enzyme)